jgi:hypothetical protein
MPFASYRLGTKGEDAPPADFFIATSCGSGRPCANYVMSMVDSADYLRENGVTFDYWLHAEDCHVDDARNFLVQQFMASDCKSMVFIDDDVGWDTEGLAKLLCYKDVDIVGGAYPLRQLTEDYPIRRLMDNPVMQARADGLLEVEGIPTGFMRIERHVIDAIAEKRKHLKFYAKEARQGDTQMQVIFERLIADGHRWSGDLNFCREARQLGFKVHVDPEINFTHMGNRKWEGNLGRFLRKKNGVLDPRLDGAVERLITGDNSIEVFKDIHKFYDEPYAMGPRSLKEVYDRCFAAKGPILECGSGITTIIAAIACLRNGQMVHSLEHDLDWFRHVRNYINLWKVKPAALYYAPLAEYPDPDNDKMPMMWYGDGVLDDLPKEFDVVLIDGPPRRYRREGVYKLVGDRIKNAVWIVDDTEDPKELASLTKYVELYGKKMLDMPPVGQGVRRYSVVE